MTGRSIARDYAGRAALRLADCDYAILVRIGIHPSACGCEQCECRRAGHSGELREFKFTSAEGYEREGQIQ